MLETNNNEVTYRTKQEILDAAGYVPKMGRKPIEDEKQSVRLDLYVTPSVAALLPKERGERTKRLRELIKKGLGI